MKLQEIEIKIQLQSHDHFRQTFELCQKIYGDPASHVRQLDEYYDSKDEQLKGQDLVLRIRSFDGTCMIALKSPRVQLPGGSSNRIELEFAAADEGNVRTQLKNQGLFVRESAEKERWTFFVSEDIEIVFDRLPFLGTFVEIEGPGEEAILQIMETLHLQDTPYIRKNYGELMVEKFAALNLSQKNIQATFAEEEKFHSSSLSK